MYVCVINSKGTIEDGDSEDANSDGVNENGTDAIASTFGKEGHHLDVDGKRAQSGCFH